MRRLKVQDQDASMVLSGAEPLLGCRSHLLCIPSCGGRGSGFLWASFIWALIPLMGASHPLWPNQSPKGPLPDSISRVRISVCEFERKHSDHSWCIFQNTISKWLELFPIGQKGPQQKMAAALGLGLKDQHKSGQILKRSSHTRFSSTICPFECLHLTVTLD